MEQIELSVLKEVVDLRSVWKNEASDFTPWLCKERNIERLSDAVGLEITVEERESLVGEFSADIFAKETGTDRKIIIENQLEDTNHDHLGKIITYAAGKNASYVIWIVKHAREEHKAAIEWLNENTNDDIGFFLCEIKLYQIDDSKIAPMFVAVSVPNDWKKNQKRLDNKELSKSEQYFERFWDAFNNHAWKDQNFAKTFRKRKAPTRGWYVLSSGISGAQINLIRFSSTNAICVELYIPNNKNIFDQLHRYREEIEEETGIRFNWRRLDDKIASIIRIKENFLIQKEDDFSEGFDWLMNSAMKMKSAFLKYI
jgi:hypothetical protein